MIRRIIGFFKDMGRRAASTIKDAAIFAAVALLVLFVVPPLLEPMFGFLGSWASAGATFVGLIVVYYVYRWLKRKRAV